MMPSSWQMRGAPNYYASRVNLVWHKSPTQEHSGAFIQRSFPEHTVSMRQSNNFLKAGLEEKVDLDRPMLHKGQMEVWYVNLPDSKERKQCLEGQLKKQLIEPHRFDAVRYPTKCEGGNKNCMRKQFSDCIQGGINWEAVSHHGTVSKGAGMVQKGVIANWCSHKRILDELATQNKTDQEKYYVILEDDVILAPNFRLKLENFIAGYTKSTWDFIQVDPFGAEGKAVAFHNGKVTAPSAKGTKIVGDNYGMHCLVVKQSKLDVIQKYFGTHEVIPIDWIAKDIPNMITWAGGVTMNPEGHNGPAFPTPAYCKAGIFKSTIAGEKENDK